MYVSFSLRSVYFSIETFKKNVIDRFNLDQI